MSKDIVQVISVTRDHKRKGIPGDPKSCPIALAITEAIPDTSLASVTKGVRWEPETGEVRVGFLPWWVMLWIMLFDIPFTRWMLPPITFELTLWDKWPRRARW